MSQTVGHFVAPTPSGLRLSVDAERLAVSWRHCGRVADLLAHHLAALTHPGGGGHAFQTITYVANELIENAYKFREGGGLSFSGGVVDEGVLLHVSNRAPPDRAQKLVALIQRMSGRDPGELLVERIEANIAAEQDDRSGLGFITLMADYEARLGWRIEPLGDHVQVTVSALFPV